MTQFTTNLNWEANLHQATTCRYPEGARLMGVQLYTEKNSWIWLNENKAVFKQHNAKRKNVIQKTRK